MLIDIAANGRRGLFAAALVFATTAGTAPLAAQSVQAVDPDKAINTDLAPPQQAASDYRDPGASAQPTAPEAPLPPTPSDNPAPAAAPASELPTAAEAQSQTYKQDDLIGAAEGVFGKGAHGVAKMIQSILKKQGEPDGYIVGREAGGAIGVGVRYGSGTLFHKVEGQMPVYWTGPSIGFDLGANAASTFVLVYNLNDTDDLYKRFPAGEGDAYMVGGLTASYLRKGDIVLIPIRVGAGLRLGVNAGYMKFSKKQRWVPF